MFKDVTRITGGKKDSHGSMRMKLTRYNWDIKQIRSEHNHRRVSGDYFNRIHTHWTSIGQFK